MNTLIVTAHPASYGFTHKIAQTYKETEESTGNTAEIIDLYDDKYAQPFFCFENLKEDCGPTVTKDLIHEKISWADELVVVFPVWQLGMPAILKNFFDTNFNAGFGFKYSKDGLQKLLVGKRIRFFLTADGPAWFYWLYKPVLKYISIGGFLKNYCGIYTKSIDVFSSMYKKKNDVDREKMLKLVKKEALQK